MRYDELTRQVLKAANRALRSERVMEALGVERRSGSGSKALGTLGLLGIGVLAGAALGLLLAPQTGEALRRELAERLGLEAEGDEDLSDEEESLDELIT